jgi:hypothetical protein
MEYWKCKISYQFLSTFELILPDDLLSHSLHVLLNRILEFLVVCVLLERP